MPIRRASEEPLHYARLVVGFPACDRCDFGADIPLLSRCFAADISLLSAPTEKPKTKMETKN
jgi:hypothetical protein